MKPWKQKLVLFIAALAGMGMYQNCSKSNASSPGEGAYCNAVTLPTVAVKMSFLQAHGKLQVRQNGAIVFDECTSGGVYGIESDNRPGSLEIWAPQSDFSTDQSQTPSQFVVRDLAQDCSDSNVNNANSNIIINAQNISAEEESVEVQACGGEGSQDITNLIFKINEGPALD